MSRVVARSLSSSSSCGYDLRRDLRGSFTARACSLLAQAFILLDPVGEVFGRLRFNGASDVEFRSEGCVVVFEASGRSYRMVVDGEEVLVADPKGWPRSELNISCGDQSYEARVSFFRNLAIASHPDGETVVRLSGGLTGRRYEILYSTEAEYALLVAVFLLWHVVVNRRRAYRIEGGMV
jgi:hypothetical protein